MQVLLYFIIPIKMKWMAAVYVVIMVFSVWDTYHAIYAYTQSVSTALWYAGIMLLCIVMSLLNYLIFFLSYNVHCLVFEHIYIIGRNSEHRLLIDLIYKR